ncbi:hypothetical protein HPB47_013258 [Ixodes persulcatus]|uniref:Uncharacterized protein n=1 Tax=Ixodes persulcatus TaxID=34615 RepID=A0AC60QYY5_IXOPE|nr:hypothetical protein HPB47_013258 [Ixodes persulcatus]
MGSVFSLTPRQGSRCDVANRRQVAEGSILNSREQALQSECKAASALLGKMQAQQAEFSHAKSQESEELKAQLVSLSLDLAKQLELVDAKVEEADTPKEKFEASQLEL